MSMTLVDDLTGLFKSQALGDAAAQLGESEGSVLRGFQAASAAIIDGLANRAGQTGFMKQILDMINGPLNDSKILENVRGFFSSRLGSGSTDGTGSKMLSMLFGGDQSKVAESVSQASGLRFRSASTIMSLAAPLVFGLLGRRVQEDHLDASSLSNFLRREGTDVRSMVPAGLHAAAGVANQARAEAVHVARSGSNWLWPLLAVLAALVAFIWLLGRGRNEAARVTSQAVNTVNTAVTDLGDFVHTKLVNGIELNIPRLGMESRLLQFIQDSSRPVDTTTWFDFDRLVFDTNSATLRADSEAQLSNIAAILKAYPNVKVKIGGYTDNTGDQAVNMRLSQERAESVRQELINRGIAPDRMASEGYGSQYPVADNSTEEGRAKNRRIALRVTEK